MHAEEKWASEVGRRVAQGMSQPAAIRAVVREMPEVHASYVRAYNEQLGRPAGRFAPRAKTAGAR